MADEASKNIAESVCSHNDDGSLDKIASFNKTPSITTPLSNTNSHKEKMPVPIISSSDKVAGVLSLVNGQLIVTPVVANDNQQQSVDAQNVVQVETGASQKDQVCNSKIEKIEGKASNYKYKCKQPQCHWSFRTLYKLQRHEKAHTGEKPYKCPIDGCERTFSQLYNLKVHAMNHKDKIICSKKSCHRTFETIEESTAHYKKCHQQDTNNPTTDENESNGSSETYSSDLSQSELPKGVLQSMRKRKYVCNQEGCHWSFLSSSKLKRHLITHTDQKTFICDIDSCGKSFRRESHLKQHAITHTGEKPYACSIEGCKGRFSARTSLNVHMRKHEIERPFKCSFPGCDKGYITPANLKAHMKKHEGCEAPSSSSLSVTTSSYPDESSIVTSESSITDDCGIVDRLTLESLPRFAVGILPHEFAAAAFGEAACAQYIASDAFDNINTSDTVMTSPSTWHDDQHQSMAMTTASFMELESSLEIDNEDHFTLLQNGTSEVVSSLMQSDITVSISQSSPCMSESRQFLPMNDLPEVPLSDSVLIDHLYANQSDAMNFDMIDSHCVEIVTGDSFIETTINLQDIR